jgi:hypothetical protein
MRFIAASRLNTPVKPSSSEIGLAHHHLVGVQQPPHMTHGAARIIEQHERLIAAPDGIPLHVGKRGLHIDEVAALHYSAHRIDVVHFQVKRAFLLAALPQHQIG